MSRYLEEAAAQLRKVATDIDKQEARYSSGYRDERRQLAEAFGQLAAIEKGLIPGEMVGDLLARIVRDKQRESDGRR